MALEKVRYYGLLVELIILMLEKLLQTQLLLGQLAFLAAFRGVYQAVKMYSLSVDFMQNRVRSIKK